MKALRVKALWRKALWMKALWRGIQWEGGSHFNIQWEPSNCLLSYGVSLKGQRMTCLHPVDFMLGRSNTFSGARTVLHAREEQCILESKNNRIFIFQSMHKLCSIAMSIYYQFLLAVTCTTCCSVMSSSLELPQVHCSDMANCLEGQPLWASLYLLHIKTMGWADVA
jgi:hypothetical protein